MKKTLERSADRFIDRFHCDDSSQESRWSSSQCKRKGMNKEVCSSQDVVNKVSIAFPPPGQVSEYCQLVEFQTIYASRPGEYGHWRSMVLSKSRPTPPLVSSNPHGTMPLELCSVILFV